MPKKKSSVLYACRIICTSDMVFAVRQQAHKCGARSVVTRTVSPNQAETIAKFEVIGDRTSFHAWAGKNFHACIID